MTLTYRALLAPTAAQDASGNAMPGVGFTVRPLAGGDPVPVYGSPDTTPALTTLVTDQRGNLSGFYVDAPGPYTLDFGNGVSAVTLAVRDERDTPTVADLTEAVTTVGTGGGGRLLAGSGPPASGSGLDPLDGVNDPWRWSPHYLGWVSVIREVTWVEGATTIQFQLPEGADELDLAIIPGPGLLDNDGSGYGTAVVPLVPTALPVTTISAGSGIAFLVQNEVGFAGPTTVPAPGLDVANFLGEGFTVGDAHPLPEANTGVNGDFYRDISSPAGVLIMYGPKANGVWPAPLTVGDPQVIYSPNNIAYRVVVADDGSLSTEIV